MLNEEEEEEEEEEEDRQCTYKVTMRRFVKKTIIITYSESICVALGIKHAMRMRHAICVLSGSTIFSTLSHEEHDFRIKKLSLNIKCVF